MSNHRQIAAAAKPAASSITATLDTLVAYMSEPGPQGAPRWCTLAELARVIQKPEASASARVRDLRKPYYAEKYGIESVELQPVPGKRTFLYALFLARK